MADASPDPLKQPSYVVARSLLLCRDIRFDAPVPAIARKVQDHARRHFALDVHGSALKDLELWVRALLGDEDSGQARHPADRLYGQLWDALSLEVRWEADGPVVPTRHVRTWLGVLNDFDESFLLCYDRLRHRRLHDPLPDIPEAWGVVTHVGDIQLDALLDGRATDLHVHLSGLRQSGLAWARTMAAERGWADHADLTAQFKSALDASWEAVATQAHRDRLVIGDWLERPPITLAQVWRDPDPAALLHDERVLLASALLEARRARARPSGPLPDERRGEAAFWRYVSAKHQFQLCTRQPAFDGAPGLAHFDRRYFRATKHRSRDTDSLSVSRTGPRIRSGKSFTHAELKAPARVIAGDHCLQQVELRISPFERATDYLRFLRAWQEVMDELQKSGRYPRLPRVRFAVHLVRTTTAHAKRLDRARRLATGELDRVHWRTFHGEIARQTAVLQNAVADQRYGDLTRLLARVDVAGQERDTPIELFTPHLRLLRGDEPAIALLEDIADSRRGIVRDPEAVLSRRAGYDHFIHAAEWQRMALAGRHRARPGGALRLTLHAGEEFGDPLEGLFQIWAAVQTSAMLPGESIGHGLALGVSCDDWGAPFARVSPLQHRASLLWLRYVLREIDPALLWTPAGSQLSELINRADRPMPRTRTIEEMEREFKELYMPKHGLAAITEEIWSCAARDDLGVGATERKNLAPLVTRAQDWLRQWLIDREIVIEGNPSSNLRISGAGALADLPTVALFEHVRDGLLFCVNTDNPGTFAASIQTEYAMLVEGARERARRARSENLTPMDDLVIRDLLDRVLEIGRSLMKGR